MADYYVDENGKITRSKKKRTDYTVDENGKISIVGQEKEELKPSDYGTTKDDDIAPVKSGERTWFQSGAMDDDAPWYERIGKTILGTAQDVGDNLMASIVNLPETLLDAALTVAPYIAQGQYYQNGGGFNIQADQAFNQAIATSKKDTEEFVKKDLYDAEKVAKKINSVSLMNTLGADAENDSVLGEKSDSLVQSAGQLGVQIGVNAVLPGSGIALMGVTAFGGEAENALKNGATLDEATLSGAISAGAEILTEKIGGISFGGKTLTDAAFNQLSRHMTGKLSKVLLTTGKVSADALSEGGEEILSGYMSAIGQKLSYMEEKEIEELFSDEDKLESFIGGVVLGGMGGVGGVVQSNSKGVDYVTELTKNEQKVVEKVYKDRVAEAEKKGKISGTEKSKIYDDVLEKMEKGYLSTDDIESALGDRSAYDALQKESEEFKTLYETESGKLSKKQQDRLAELEAKNKATPYETALKDAKSKYSKSVFNLVRGENKGRGSRLLETYNEKARMGQDFQADFEKYKGTKHEEAARKTIESAIQAGANNTNRVHDLVDMAAQISADTGRTFYFKSGEQIKADFLERQQKVVAEMESIPEAKRTAEQTKKLTDLKDLIAKVKSGEIKVNGDITEDGITLNLDSTKPLNRTVGHEVTHSLEKAKSYKELKESLFAYAKSKGIDIESELNTRKLMYEGITDANPEAELVSDLVGDFLFTDSNYIKKLSTENRNVFQKIWDEVKYLYSVATAGSQEARELAKVKKAFEDAYRESAEKNTADGGVKLSIETLPDGKKYVRADRQVIFGTDPDSWSEQVESYINGKIRNGENISLVAEDGEILVLTADTAGKISSNKTNHGTTMDDEEFAVKANAGVHIDELAQISVNADPNKSPVKDRGSRHGAFAEGGWTYRYAFFQDFDGKYYRLKISAAKGADGNVVYNIGDIEERSFPKVTGSSAKGGALNGKASFDTKVAQEEGIVKRDYSLSSIANTFFGDETMTSEQFTKKDYRETQGYKDYVEQCLNNYRQTRADFNEDEARKAIEDSIEGIVRVAIASKQAGYDILDDANKRNMKDSKNRLLFSSLEPNSDYFTSNDISTICDKRKNFAEIYDDIVKAEEAKGVPKGKRFFDNVDNYFAIHKIMADKGLTTPCRQCYVESMRKNLAPMANAFLRLVQETNATNTSNDQLYHQSGKQKGELKTSNASTRDFVLSALEAHPEYNMSVSDLTVETLTTAEGLAQLKLQAPMVYEAFNSFYGQSKPKMPKAATPFRFGELTALLTDEKGKIKQSLVDKINSTGGFRLQSYSDFQIQNYTDVLQVLFEAGTLGLNGHAYTKVPAFLDATKDTNLKRNISIFMYKDGDQWKLDKNDSFPYDLEEIYDLVKDDKTGNTGIIAVSQNADMSAWIMANDYVGYGIPFHKSGLKMGTVRDTEVKTDDGRIIKGYSGTIDHTKQQTEVWAKAADDHKALTKVKKGINIYSFWDFDNKSNLSKNELIEKNVKAYIDQCELVGYLPKFRAYVMDNGKVLNDVLKYSKELGFVSEDATISDISFQYKGYTIPYGYYKFLGDFGMFTPDGKAAGQKTLSLENYDFDKAVEFFSDAETLRRNEILQQFANGKERREYRDSDLIAEELQEIVKQKRSEVVKDVVPGAVQNSLSAKGEQFAPSANDIYGKDFRVQNPAQEIAPVAENATTVSETESVAPVAVSEKETTTEEMFPDDLAPAAETDIQSLTDADAPAEAEAPYYEDAPVAPRDPFKERDFKGVGKRDVHAYMYDNPEVKPYFQMQANAMLGDLQNSVKGERWYNDDVYYESGGEYGWSGTERQTTDDIAYLLDMGYTYAQIEKGLNAIIEDNGAENIAMAKRIEFALNERLMKGYTDINGVEIPANEEYLNVLAQKEKAEAVEGQIAPHTDADAPVAETETTTEDIAPVKDQPKTEQKVAKVKVNEEVKTKKTTGAKVREFWDNAKKTVNTAVSTFGDKGWVFENLSKKTKNRELEAKYNFLHYSESRAQEYIKDNLMPIVERVKKTGKTEDVFNYVYHLHNIDRMSLESDENRIKRESLRENFKGLTDKQIENIAMEWIKKDTPKAVQKRIKLAREYIDANKGKNKPVFGESITANVSREAVKKYEAENPEFKELEGAIVEYNRQLRKMLVDGNVISQKTADMWEKMYPHYVPIRRSGKDGLGVTVPLDTNKTGVNAPIKRATGGDSDIEDLFETMVMRTEQTFKAIAKNSFGVELMHTLDSTVAKEQTTLDKILDSFDSHEDLLQEGKNGKSPTFTVFEDGKRVTFDITKEMYDALKPTSENLAKTYKIPNKLSNIHRGLLTDKNPVFLATNAVKDVQDVMLNSQHAGKTYMNFPAAIGELASHGHWYKEYMANGGEQNTYFDSDSKTFKGETKGVKKWINAISEANNFIERIPRLAEYIASRKSGRSIEVSMLDAARVTTNFAAGADVTKFLNRNGFTFLNASVQGAMQQARNVREANSNGLRGWAVLAGKVAGVGLAHTILNHLLWDDDEDYEELSDYVKQNYYIVAKTDDGKFIRIPKGRTMAVIQEAFTQMEKLITGDDEVDLKNFAELVIANLAPNNPLENNILAPVIQTATNKTWYGEDLVPTRLQDVPNAEQYDESIDWFSKWLGEKTDFSPYKINYLLNQYSGGIGDVFLPMMTPEAENGDSVLGQFVAPWKDKFSTDSVMKNQNVSDFYDKVDELTVNANSSKATDEDKLMSKYMNSVSSELSELYKQKREIQNSDKSNSEKYAEVHAIQQQIVDLMRESLNSYSNVEIDGKYAKVGEVQFRWYEPGEDSEAEPGWKKLTDDQIEKQDKVTSGLGISPSEYWSDKDEYDFKYEYPDKYEFLRDNGVTYDDYKNGNEEFKDAWTWASKNPEKFTMSKAVASDVATYRKYTKALNEIKADKDSSGKTISGSRKEKVIDYINNLDATYGEKIILYKSLYEADNTYNNDIVEYLNSRNDISYQDTVTILRELGFTVLSDGTVQW